MDDSATAVDEAAMDPSMADATMDVAMMEDVPEMPAEEAPAAPSVVFCPGGCEAVMKIKRADDDSSTDPESDNVKSVVEYEVKFGSSGVTSGGLLFGAAISIDEEGTGAATANGVNAASAYIGAADGTWKLNFGSNDPGIDLVGNIGLADADAISAKTLVIKPVMIGTALQLKLPAMASAETLVSPETELGDTKDEKDAAIKSNIQHIVRYFSGQIDGYFTNVMTATEASKIANWQPISAPKGTIEAERVAATVTGGTEITVVVEGVGVKTVDPTTGTVNYSDNLVLLHQNTSDAVKSATEATSRTDIGLSGKVGSFEYRLTTSQPGDDAWSFGANYKAGGITVGLGMDSNDVTAVGLKGEFGGSTISGTYVKQSGEDYTGAIAGGTQAAPTVYAGMLSVNEWTAMGVKFHQKIGSGTSVALAYSKKDDKNKNADGIVRDSNKAELDFEYSLGGGATFFAGLDRLSEDMAHYTVATGVPAATKKTRKTTTIEAGIKMTF